MVIDTPQRLLFVLFGVATLLIFLGLSVQYLFQWKRITRNLKWLYFASLALIALAVAAQFLLPFRRDFNLWLLFVPALLCLFESMSANGWIKSKRKG